MVSQRTQEGEDIVKVALEHHSYALCGQSATQIVVLVIVAVVGFETYRSGAVEEIFDVKVAYERVVVKRFVAVAEVAVEQQAVVEQMA